MRRSGDLLLLPKLKLLKPDDDDDEADDAVRDL